MEVPAALVVLLSDGMSDAAVVEVVRAGMDVVVPSSLEVVVDVVVALVVSEVVVAVVLSSLVVVLS